MDALLCAEGCSGPAGIAICTAYLVLACASVALALTDMRNRRLPDAILVPALLAFSALATIATLLGAETESLARAAFGGATLGALYAALRLLSRGGMGLGDVKLALLLGAGTAWVGWRALVLGTAAAFLLGGLCGVVILSSRRTAADRRFPFGPWMILGGWIGIVAIGVVAIASG